MEKISEIHPTAVRTTPDLKEWLKKRAKANRRSMSEEINYILLKEKAQDARTS